MIKNLSVQNIGGISNISLEFSSGLNVITGESGAGKSSIVRSLELLTGVRKGVKFIRAGENKGIAQAELSTGQKITREILSTGRSSAKINGVNIAISDFTDEANNLIRIQSQFAQLELLDAERQLQMLDSYMPEKIINGVMKEFENVFENAKAKNIELRTLKKRRSEIEKEYSNAREIFELIKTAKPEQGLENKLENELSDITHNILMLERAEKAYDILTGGLSENGLLEKIRSEYEFLYGFMSDDNKEKITDALDILDGGIKNFTSELNDIKSEIERRDEIENRLGALRRLKRLSGRSDEKELLQYSEDIYKNLEWLEKSYDDLKNLTASATELKKHANALAMTIRKYRYEAGNILSSRVNNLLNELGMSEIKFDIKFTGLQKLKHNGADEAEFILTDGTRSGSVDKIASGGELSRLLLALQLSLPDELLTPTLVFDEVEAGLGGRAAVLTGMQLKKLSERCQVILITHEASIAALGDVHFLIQRENNESLVKKISGFERIKEIARMLSGSPELAEAQEHARILLQNSAY